MVPHAEYVSARPVRELADLVRSAHGYDLRGYAPGTHLGVPSPTLTFIVALHDGVDVAGMPRSDRAPRRFRALVGGLHDGPVTIRHDGTQAGVQLALSPAGARALLGPPTAALTGEVVDLADLWGQAAADELVDRVATASGWDERMAVVGSALRARAADAAPSRDPALDGALRLLTDPGTHRPVAEVARAVGWSRRNLSDRVSREYGFSPVVLRSLARFDVARQAVTAASPGTLAQVAARCGYTDQAHMAREFRRFLGRSPTRWMAEEDFPSVQDEPLAPSQDHHP